MLKNRLIEFEKAIIEKENSKRENNKTKFFYAKLKLDKMRDELSEESIEDEEVDYEEAEQTWYFMKDESNDIEVPRSVLWNQNDFYGAFLLLCRTYGEETKTVRFWRKEFPDDVRVLPLHHTTRVEKEETRLFQGEYGHSLHPVTFCEACSFEEAGIKFVDKLLSVERKHFVYEGHICVWRLGFPEEKKFYTIEPKIKYRADLLFADSAPLDLKINEIVGLENLYEEEDEESDRDANYRVIEILPDRGSTADWVDKVDSDSYEEAAKFYAEMSDYLYEEPEEYTVRVWRKDEPHTWKIYNVIPEVSHSALDISEDVDEVSWEESVSRPFSF